MSILRWFESTFYGSIRSLAVLHALLIWSILHCCPFDLSNHVNELQISKCYLQHHSTNNKTRLLLSFFLLPCASSCHKTDNSIIHWLILTQRELLELMCHVSIATFITDLSTSHRTVSLFFLRSSRVAQHARGCGTLLQIITQYISFWSIPRWSLSSFLKPLLRACMIYFTTCIYYFSVFSFVVLKHSIVWIWIDCVSCLFEKEQLTEPINIMSCIHTFFWIMYVMNYFLQSECLYMKFIHSYRKI